MLLVVHIFSALHKGCQLFLSRTQVKLTYEREYKRSVIHRIGFAITDTEFTTSRYLKLSVA